MTVSWGTIKSVLFFFGPLLIPKAWQYYKSVQAAPAIHGISVRTIPPKVQRALLILFVTALAFFLRTFSSPENVFSRTSSRLQIPTDVLFTRLSALRPAGLTASDEILRGKLNSLESRLLFFQFGPDVIAECGFCNAEDPKSYLYYSIPSIAAPYLFNLCVLAVVTSGLFTGKEGAIWRTTATIAGVAIAAFEFYLVSSYHYQGNSRATRLEDIDPFFWKMRIYRYLMIAAVDGVIGWMLYLSSTNRAFVTPPSTAERLETSTKLIATASGKMQALAIARNSICRDPELNNQSRNYWVHEGMIMGEVMAEREVVNSRNNALKDRIDIQRVRIDAAAFADQIIGPLPGTPGI